MQRAASREGLGGRSSRGLQARDTAGTPHAGATQQASGVGGEDGGATLARSFQLCARDARDRVLGGGDTGAPPPTGAAAAGRVARRSPENRPPLRCHDVRKWKTRPFRQT